MKKAWKDYKNSECYKYLCSLLITEGINQPYCDNILKTAFNAGYNSKYSPEDNYKLLKDINHPWL